jgi:hypothetical protein
MALISLASRCCTESSRRKRPADLESTWPYLTHKWVEQVAMSLSKDLAILRVLIRSVWVSNHSTISTDFDCNGIRSLTTGRKVWTGTSSHQELPCVMGISCMFVDLPNCYLLGPFVLHLGPRISVFRSEPWISSSLYRCEATTSRCLYHTAIIRDNPV